MNNHAEYVS